MKNILIIGASEFGKHFAKKSTELGNEVCIVDIDEKAIHSFVDDYENTLIGDCRDINVLRQIGVNHFDVCVVSVGGDFQASLEITANLKELDAACVIAQCQSENQAKFLKMAGANRTVYPEKETAEKIAYVCNSEKIIDFFEVNAGAKIVKLSVPHKWVGKSIVELNVRQKFNVIVIAIEQGDSVIIPEAGTVFGENDLVMIFGKDEHLRKIIKE
ncbi:MAG: TrkA family potassium uptake protein [Clostridia bacterium]|nr:TrkA family potassium uptake protein [Clostridia bacterium]